METGTIESDSRRWLRLVLVVIATGFLTSLAARGGSPQEPAAVAKDGLVGTFADEHLTVFVTGGAGRYTGAFAIAGRLYPFTAYVFEGGAIEGTFDSAGKDFVFTAALEAGVLVLRSDGAVYRLPRKVAPAATGNPLVRGTPLKPGFKLHKHALGFSLQVPEAWKVLESPGGLLLTPPDVKQDSQGPAEAFVVTGAPAEGVEDPGDPRVQQYVQGALAQTLGSQLRAVGGVETMQAGPRKAAVMTWKGTFANGNRFRTRAYVVMIAGHGVSLSYVGSTLQLKRRDPVLREIVATFASDAPASGPAAAGGKADKRLVGRWYRSVYRRSALPGGISTSFHQTMLLAPDGKLSWVDQTVLTGSQPAGQASSGWTFSGIPESSVNRGTWTATGNTVRMTWSGGKAVYDVHVQGAAGRREMLLTPRGGGEKELWTEYAN